MTPCRSLLGIALVMAGLAAPGATETSPPPAVAASSTNVNPVNSAAEGQAKADPVAGRFAVMCAGCHSLTGAKLNGPELTPSTSWPLDQLKPAIKRMEKNVGPLTDEQVAELAEFMKAPDIRERIKSEQERIQAQFMAKMAPPDPVLGKGLFFGSEPLRQGGQACAACHAAAGVGGNLGTDLTGVAAKMGGETPLVSAIEQASFKLMAPHYKRHPITKQEAMHLAKYLASLDLAQVAPAQASFMPVGGGLALAVMAGLVFTLRQQRRSRGRDVKLQRRRK